MIINQPSKPIFMQLTRPKMGLQVGHITYALPLTPEVRKVYLDQEVEVAAKQERDQEGKQ